MRRNRPYRVRILYKSGNHIEVDCDNFNVQTTVHGTVGKVSWENPNIEPLYLGIDSIEAVWSWQR